MDSAGERRGGGVPPGLNGVALYKRFGSVVYGGRVLAWHPPPKGEAPPAGGGVGGSFEVCWVDADGEDVRGPGRPRARVLRGR